MCILSCLLLLECHLGLILIIFSNVFLLFSLNYITLIFFDLIGISAHLFRWIYFIALFMGIFVNEYCSDIIRTSQIRLSNLHCTIDDSLARQTNIFSNSCLFDCLIQHDFSLLSPAILNEDISLIFTLVSGFILKNIGLTLINLRLTWLRYLLLLWENIDRFPFYFFDLLELRFHMMNIGVFRHLDLFELIHQAQWLLIGRIRIRNSLFVFKPASLNRIWLLDKLTRLTDCLKFTGSLLNFFLALLIIFSNLLNWIVSFQNNLGAGRPIVPRFYLSNLSQNLFSDPALILLILCLVVVFHGALIGALCLPLLAREFLHLLCLL